MNTTHLNADISFINQLGYQDLESWILVQRAYKYNCSDMEIEDAGFNLNSGYLYIYLENGISICSAFGQEVEFLVTDPYTGEESFFDSYGKAIERQIKLEGFHLV